MSENQGNLNKRGVYKDAEYKEFVEFIALPRIMRNKEFGFQTQKEFAKKYDLDQSTLTIWKNKDGFWDEVKRKRKEWGKERTPDVILGLYKRAARDGRGTDAKAWMEIVEDWKQEEEYDVHSGEMAKLAKAIKELASHE